MNVVLQNLESRGLVTRPATAPHGRELPTVLTPAGQDQLHAASTAVRGVEQKMCARLTAEQEKVLVGILRTFCRNLADGA
jgi:DNA-binding MarR family transcriptional regulator